MGKPTKSHFLVLPAEYIGRIEVTGGTETSKYPEEEKSNEIPLVVASERGIAQTCFVATLSRGCRTTLSYLDCEKNVLERTITEGDNPVFEA